MECVKMKKTIGIAAIIAGLGMFTAGAALAAGKESNPTVGNCISDIVYGNEPNMRNGADGGALLNLGPADQPPGSKGGNVVPTQSPGPFVNNPLDPDNPIRGRSVGQFMQDGINIPALCRAAFGPN